MAKYPGQLNHLPCNYAKYSSQMVLGIKKDRHDVELA